MACVNAMEEIVREKVSELIEESGCCTCKKCRRDIECLALNAMPAKYASTPAGMLFSKLSQGNSEQCMIDLNVACVNAIETVKNNPRH